MDARVSSSAWLLIGLLCAAAPLAEAGTGTVVALTPALAQICYEVLPATEMGRVVGVPEHARLPPGAAPSVVASAVNLDREKLIALRAETVLYSGSHATRAGGAGWQEVRVDTLRDIAAAYRRIGGLLSHRERGEELARRFEQGIAGLKGILGASAVGVPRRMFFQLDGDPLISVGGRGDFLPELLAWMGAGNIFSSLEQAYPRVTREAVLAGRPQLIVVIGLRAERTRFGKVARSWGARPVMVFDGDELTLPSLSLVSGARNLAEAIKSHPGTSFRD